jgi:hypothetical protein
MIVQIQIYWQLHDRRQQGCQMVCFLKPKIQIWVNLEGPAMEDVGIFYGQLVHFIVLCYTLWTFSIVRGNLVYFYPFWYFVPRKIWQPRASVGLVLFCRVEKQGCQMAYFQTKNHNLGIFGRALKWNMLVYFVQYLEYCEVISYM